MKLPCLFSCLLLISAVGFAQTKQDSTKTVGHEKLTELHQRLKEKDYMAFSEAAELPAIISIPFLYYYSQGGQLDRELGPRAREAFKHVHGFKEDYQEKIKNLTDQAKEPLKEFSILIWIGSREAAEVVAPYLFDSRFPNEGKGPTGDFYGMTAAQSLGEMHFADAPTANTPNHYSTDDQIAWQKWAIDKGLVPKDWKSRVGVSENERKTYPARHSVPAPENEGQLPDPSDAKRVMPPKPSGNSAIPTAPVAMTTKAAEPASLASHWALWAGFAVTLAGIAAWLVMRSRGRKGDEK